MRYTNSLRDDAQLKALLDRLYARSVEQLPALAAYVAETGAKSFAGSPEEIAAGRAFWSDKFVALDRDKAEFCYLLCRALDAHLIVEAGTSYGVSTLSLAAAARDNASVSGRKSLVIGTEYEPEKAKIAHAHFAEAGLSDFIELREGDLRETLKTLAEPVDFLLLDIWIPMVRPTLELVVPRMRKGAIVVCDATTAFRKDYAPLFEFLSDPANGLASMTLPFNDGFEMAVKLA